MSGRWSSVPILLMFTIVVTACEPSLTKLAEEIATAEHADPLLVEQAIKNAAAEAHVPPIDVAKSWSDFRPTEVVGGLPDLSSSLVSDARFEAHAGSTPPWVQSILESVDEAKAQEVMAEALCSLGADALRNRRPPTPDEVLAAVFFAAFGQNLPAVKFIEVTRDVNELLSGGDGDGFWEARMTLVKYQYCS